MKTSDVRKVVELMTPGCWAKVVGTHAVVPIEHRSRYNCFQFGFMFEEFWYFKEATTFRKKYIDNETARVARKLR